MYIEIMDNFLIPSIENGFEDNEVIFRYEKGFSSGKAYKFI